MNSNNLHTKEEQCYQSLLFLHEAAILSDEEYTKFSDKLNQYIVSKFWDEIDTQLTDGQILIDAQSQRTAAICKLAGVDDIEDLSDGFHTFNDLYYQRVILFATIVNQNKDKAWKSFKHEDGAYCFDSDGKWFIVGVDTPEGSYTYHYEVKYWDLFKCPALEVGKHWDGHTDKDVARLLSLTM